MAVQSPDEFTRFTMTNLSLRDSNGEVDKSSLKDWQTQVDSMTKALNSATNSLVKVITQVDVFGKAFATFDVPKGHRENARTVFNQKLIDFETKYDYLAGSLAQDPYNEIAKESDYRKISYNKNFYGSQSKKVLRKTVEDLGGTVENNPSKTQKDRMKITFPVSESDWQEELLKTEGNETKARNNLTSRYTRRNLKLAEKYSDDVASANKDKQEQKEKERKDKEDRQSTMRALGTIAIVLKVLQTIADVTRRILTATLSRASDIKREGLDARSLGVSYNNIRHYSTVEGSMGLKEGTIVGAIGSLQSAFGNISRLDENALSELAKVMGGGVINAINAGLGRNNPEALMANILDTYFKRGQSGINSIGQRVGQYQAERELASALEKAGFSDMADILRNMFYTNGTGVYKDRVSDFASYSALSTTYTMGLTSVDHKKAQELGQTIDELKTRFNDLKKNLEEGLLLSLQGLINKIDNWDIGKSPTEKLDTYKTNRQLNQEAYENYTNIADIGRSLYTSSFQKAGIDVSAFGIPNVNTLEEYLAFTNTSEGRYFSPKTESQKNAYAKLIDFLNTDEGKNFIKQVNFTTSATRLANKAKEANEKGLKSGKIEYDENAYTMASFAKDLDNDFTGTWYSTTNPAVNLAYLIASYGNARDILYTSEDIFNEYLESYLGGVFTYEGALLSGSAKNLTKGLLDLAQERNPNFKKNRKEKNEDAVKRAIAEGIISDDDALNVARELAKEGRAEYGMSQKAWEKASASVKSKGATNFVLDAQAYNALAHGLNIQEVQNIMSNLSSENAKNTVASVGGYNAKTGEVQFTLTLKDSNGKERTLFRSLIRPDIIMKEGATYDFNLADITANANAKGDR